MPALPAPKLKYLVASAAEKIGRLKTNGYIWRRSGLGQMLELELLVIGVTGKISLWQALDRLEDPRLRGIEFGRLVERAESQRTRLDCCRLELAPVVLGRGAKTG